MMIKGMWIIAIVIFVQGITCIFSKEIEGLQKKQAEILPQDHTVNINAGILNVGPGEQSNKSGDTSKNDTTPSGHANQNRKSGDTVNSANNTSLIGGLSGGSIFILVIIVVVCVYKYRHKLLSYFGQNNGEMQSRSTDQEMESLNTTAPDETKVDIEYVEQIQNT